MTKGIEKVAVFLPSLVCGGAERSMLRLAHGLACRDHEVDLVLGRAAGPLLKEVPECIRTVDLKAPRVLFSLPALTAYLRRERPAVLLSAMHYANIIAIWARSLAHAPVRLVVSEHNTLSVAQQNVTDRRSRALPALMRQFYRRADGIIAVSGGVADDLARATGIPRELIHVICNPVVTPELKAKAGLPAQHPWFGAGQPPVILAAGRLKPQKDFSTLIRAFAEVRRAIPSRLLILGEGPERGTLEALARELGLETDVDMPGLVDNPYPDMTSAGVFVLSSRWEGLPTVLIEALACGVPVVSTDCPSGPREILADGKYGTLVPVQDVRSLAEAMRLALRGQGRQPTAESYRPYELATVVDQYLQIIHG